jgi:hypothetical protein
LFRRLRGRRKGSSTDVGWVQRHASIGSIHWRLRAAGKHIAASGVLRNEKSQKIGQENEGEKKKKKKKKKKKNDN